MIYERQLISMYLDYSAYQNLGGTLDETAFNRLERKAEQEIKYRTFKRIEKLCCIPTEVKDCVFELIELFHQVEKVKLSSVSNDVSNTSISSQSNDGVSISYNVVSANNIVSNLNANVHDAINKYLCNVKDFKGNPILYRGKYSYEH